MVGSEALGEADTCEQATRDSEALLPSMLPEIFGDEEA
jgi:hypothetical protein